MTKKTKFSQEMKNKVIELYLDSKNYTYREIEKFTGITEGSIGTILTLNNIPRRKPKSSTAKFGFPSRTKDPNNSATWKQGFYHMNLKFKKQ